MRASERVRWEIDAVVRETWKHAPCPAKHTIGRLEAMGLCSVHERSGAAQEYVCQVLREAL